MKHIFILGGSKEQLDLVFEAKKLYFMVHLFDGDNDCYAKKYADLFYPISIAEKDAILEKALQIRPIIVTTIATEVGNLTACYVAEKLDLTTNSYNVALNTTNKFNMKEILKKNNIPTAKAKLTNGLNFDLWDSFPAIIKPIDSSAGRGISYIMQKEEIFDAITKANLFARSNNSLIEEYINGKQFSIESVSLHGAHHIIAITEEFTRLPPNIIETKQLIPARIDINLEKKIKSFTKKVLDCFEIQYGASHLEIKLTPSGELYVIEIASRMGGWRSELINLSLGINYVQLHLFSLLNKNIKVNQIKNDTAIVKLILNHDDFREFCHLKDTYPLYLIESVEIDSIKNSEHLSDLNDFYFIHIQDKNQISCFIEEHH